MTPTPRRAVTHYGLGDRLEKLALVRVGWDDVRLLEEWLDVGKYTCTS